MQALILAAGMGRRLGELTRDRTKCMVEFNGRTLLERSLDSLIKVSIDRIVLVVGYESQAVIDLVGNSYGGVPVVYVTNSDYATTNNIYSLYLAREEFAKDDTILLESDLVYDASILTRLIADPREDLAVVDQHRAWMDGTVVTLTDDDTISQFLPKKMMVDGSYAEYFKTTNIYKFSKRYIKRSYLPFLKAYIKSVGTNEYYEQVLGVIAGINRQGLAAMRLSGERWYEIDDLQDYSIAQTMFAPTDAVHDAYGDRHGGLWRFPDVRDHCLLVNSFFPTPDMVAEMRRSFDPLLRSYPSTQHVLSQLAAQMFEIRPTQVVVGNGAAELITALGESLSGQRVAVPIPTFNEFRERFVDSEVVEVYGREGTPAFSMEDLAAAMAGADALVVVNPNNPTGACLTTAEIEQLADRAEQTNTHLILDESFVDFADPDYCRSSLSIEFLDRHPSTTVIKSISKSHGVPGARLGVMASSDSTRLGDVASRLPVWNVGAFGEYFLQIFGKYRGAYEEALIEFRAEKHRFGAALSDVQGVHVLPSQTNFFVCELADHTAASLAEALIVQSNVLIKVLTDRPGIGDGEFIRVTVRGAQDNDVLIGALRRGLAAQQLSPPRTPG